MKRISKCDIVLIICLLVGGLFVFAAWLIEVLSGKDVLLLETP